MSLQTMVRNGFVGRLHLRRGTAGATIEPRSRDLAMRLPVASMRILETGIAFTALATAVLIGLGR